MERVRRTDPTVRFGYGFLVDLSSYAQNDASKEQFELEPDVGVRDFRFLLRGRFKTERPLSWSIGYMYDGADDAWRFRQTGLTIGVPELSGQFFLGRTKEGYSLIKVMTGYYGWTQERSPALDAFVPILADGIKYMGYSPRMRLYLSLGAFGDALAEKEKFATYDRQFVTRLVWLPILSEERKELLHLGVMSRHAKPDGGAINIRSRPEDYLAPYFIETGKITSDFARTLGFEAFYRPGPWMFGTEYNWQTLDTPNGDELFHAGEVVASWMITGETRPYNAAGAFFSFVTPARSVFNGGPGACELATRMTHSPFDSGSWQGGKLWRLTAMTNWYLNEYQRLEFVYGHSALDRFAVDGGTNFFQARIQTTL